MEKKMYRECPKSYRLLCRRGHLESERKAIEQLYTDHPEIFWLDESENLVCCVFEVKYGLYVAKDRELYSGRWVTHYDSFGRERPSHSRDDRCLAKSLYGSCICCEE
jgi:hypothetical protein